MTYKLIHDGVVRDVFVADPRGGENYLICPYCAPHRKPEHQREKKLSINMDKFPKPWRCKHCDNPIPLYRRADARFCRKYCRKAVARLRRTRGRLGRWTDPKTASFDA